MEIKGYTLVNEEKANRCYNKELGAGKGATDEEVLALYDKFGGLIKKDGKVVPRGKFWNFAEKKPVKEEKKEVKKEIKKEIKKPVKK